MTKPRKNEPARDQRRSSTDDRTPPDAAPLPQHFGTAELVGESEYSTREAGERESWRHERMPGGPFEREPLSARPEDLEQRFLEDATQSPGEEELDPNLDRERDDALDEEQIATRVDEQRDEAADPIRNIPPRRNA